MTDAEIRIPRTLDNADVCRRLGINTYKAHLLLRKFGKKIGRRWVIPENELDYLLKSGWIVEIGGVVYF